MFFKNSNFTKAAGEYMSSAAGHITNARAAGRNSMMGNGPIQPGKLDMTGFAGAGKSLMDSMPGTSSAYAGAMAGSVGGAIAGGSGDNGSFMGAVGGAMAGGMIGAGAGAGGYAGMKKMGYAGK